MTSIAGFAFGRSRPFLRCSAIVEIFPERSGVRD
jgi:hypothetical protein